MFSLLNILFFCFCSINLCFSSSSPLLYKIDSGTNPTYLQLCILNIPSGTTISTVSLLPQCHSLRVVVRLKLGCTIGLQAKRVLQTLSVLGIA